MLCEGCLWPPLCGPLEENMRSQLRTPVRAALSIILCVDGSDVLGELPHRERSPTASAIHTPRCSSTTVLRFLKCNGCSGTPTSGVAVEEGDDTAKSGKQDRPKAKTARKRGTQTATGQGTPATGTGACVVTVPSSLSARIKSDPRPKANLLRAAFETHAPAVVSAHPPRPTPAIEGMQPTMVRREADEGDPFVDVLFKLRVNEKELLDEWVAQTTLTRSGFVTELLVLELE